MLRPSLLEFSGTQLGHLSSTHKKLFSKMSHKIKFSKSDLSRTRKDVRNQNFFKHEFGVFLVSFCCLCCFWPLFYLKEEPFFIKKFRLDFLYEIEFLQSCLSLCFFSIIFLQFFSNETNLKEFPLCGIILSIRWDLSKLKVKNSAVPSAPGQAKQNTVLQRRAFIKNIPIDL